MSKYTLMNKNTPLIDFHWELSRVSNMMIPVVDREYDKPWFIDELPAWLNYRSVTKHREHMEALLKQLGLQTTKDVIDFSKGLTLTDTLWVNIDDKYTWEKVNLFENEFDEVIERIAFDGGMYGAHFSTTSPEFGTNGSYAKCWHREDDDIVYLYKQGSSGAANTGNEVYSEMYASQILDTLGYSHVPYNVIAYRGHLVSRCPLMTSQSRMLLPSTSLLGRTGDFERFMRICLEKGWSEQLAELLLTDAILLNEDRHFGNIGIFCDADSFEPLGLSPIFDNGVSLCCFYYRHPKYPESESRTLLEYSESRTPSLYHNFIDTAVAVASERQIDELSKLKSFKFDTTGKYNLDAERIVQLEEVVQNQVSKLQKGYQEFKQSAAVRHLDSNDSKSDSASSETHAFGA